MPDGASDRVRVVAEVTRALTPAPPPPEPVRAVLTPTRLELKMARDRELFAAQAKYPLRENAVLTPEQLAAARAELGAAAVVVRQRAAGGLTPEQLALARAQAGYGVPKGGV